MDDRQFLEKKLKDLKLFLHYVTQRYDIAENEELIDKILDNINETKKLLEDINNLGTTVIMGTHNETFVNDYRHRVLELNRGHLVRDDYKGEYDDHH